MAPDDASSDDAALREFDVVIYGATGVTGRLAAEHLAACGGVAPGRWAVAGRSGERLARLRPGGAAPPVVIVARSESAEQLQAMTRRTAVLLNAAGPYSRCGAKVIESCIDTGTHYCDVSGEVVWVRRMLQKYQLEARHRGVVLVPMAGLDSVPSDLAAYLLRKAAAAATAPPAAAARPHSRPQSTLRQRRGAGGLVGPRRVSFAEDLDLYDPHDSAAEDGGSTSSSASGASSPPPPPARAAPHPAAGYALADPLVHVAAYMKPSYGFLGLLRNMTAGTAESLRLAVAHDGAELVKATGNPRYLCVPPRPAGRGRVKPASPRLSPRSPRSPQPRSPLHGFGAKPASPTPARKASAASVQSSFSADGATRGTSEWEEPGAATTAPPPLPPAGGGGAHAPPVGLWSSAARGAWLTPWLGGVNGKVVQRSVYVEYLDAVGHGQGAAVPAGGAVVQAHRYSEAWEHASVVAAAVSLVAMYVFSLVLVVPPLRWLAAKLFMPGPGRGPSREHLAAASLRMEFIGTRRSGAAHRLVFHLHCDPGYRASAVMAAELALLLAERPVRPGGGGFRTAASVDADALIGRLRRAGGGSLFSIGDAAVI